MAPKKDKKKPVAVTTKRAQEALKKELVHGEGAGRLKVLESINMTGVLASRVQSRDVRFEQVNMSIHGKELIQDTTVQINFGRRYGLIGANGSGKTTFLAALACRELPIPDHIDIWHVHEEAQPSEVTALQAVVDTAQKEVERLESLITKLSEEDTEGNMEIIEALGEKLDQFDTSSFLPNAGVLLHGLGFSETMMHKATKDMSGGWRMRVALAQALFKKPTLLILDEPTNHLDLGACVWLEEYLAKYPSTIILTSHSEDFMDAVCTEIMQLTVDNRLVYWGGNYSAYVQTRQEQEVNQMKAYEKEQADIAHLKEFINSCGTFSNLRKQADSKQKILDKMKEKGLTPKPLPDPKFMFNFPDAEKLAPPVVAFDEVCFSYSGKKADYLYKNVNFGIDLDSRIALVGPNGAGKSTLLKLIRGDLEAVEGQVKRHSHVRFANYNQHSAEVLDPDKSPLQFLQDKYDPISEERGEQRKSEQEWRSKLGKYGVTGELQKRKMGTFSDGQKSRVVFALMSLANPHILLLDEPTNHLDMTCIDALAEAIKAFSGGTVLVSHDFRLIDKVANQIWVCDGGVTVWKGDIKAYKVHLSKQMRKEAKARMSSCSGANTGAKASVAVAEEEEEEEEDVAPVVNTPAIEKPAETPAVQVASEEPDEKNEAKEEPEAAVEEEEPVKFAEVLEVVQSKKDSDEVIKVQRKGKTEKLEKVEKKDKTEKAEKVEKKETLAKAEKVEKKPKPEKKQERSTTKSVDEEAAKDDKEEKPDVDAEKSNKTKDEPKVEEKIKIEEKQEKENMVTEVTEDSGKSDTPADKPADNKDLPPWLQRRSRRKKDEAA